MDQSGLSGFQSQTRTLGDVDIHYVHNIGSDLQNSDRQDNREILLLLHGFPEYHGGWRELLPLLAQNYIVVAPDQRGFNRSSCPQSVDDYAAKHLVADMVNLMDSILPGRDFHLIGHDWGASIAYALAMKHRARIKTLSIINGVHPFIFQRSFSTSLEQVKASQYIHILRDQNAATYLSADNYAKTFSMLENFSTIKWLDEKTRAEYVKAWGSPERMNAMLNWYRASPMQVPKGENLSTNAPILDADPALFKITMPHLLIWGMQDTALLPVAREGLDEFAADLKIVEVEDAGHWINHTHADLLGREIQSFIATKTS